MKILAFAASLRKDSFNKKLLQLAIVPLKSAGHEVTEISLEGFPLPAFDEDIETSRQVPPAVEQLKNLILNHEALVIASPEYNHSMPGHFKNTFDWISRIRPMPWSKKCVLLMSASPGLVGGNRGLWALRIPFEAIGAFVFPGMFSLASASEAFLPDGNLKDPKAKTRLDQNVAAFLDFASKLQ